jgi:transcriptional regulator with XRE-family HTH domain
VARYDPERLVHDVGGRVRELRLARQWTQNDLAMRLRAAVQRVQNIERGSENLTLWSLARLANAFDISIEDFFSRPIKQDARRPGRPRGEPQEPTSREGALKPPTRRRMQASTKQPARRR